MKTDFLYCFIKKWFHILVYHFKQHLYPGFPFSNMDEPYNMLYGIN